MTSRLEQGSLVTVFGGSGFVGRHAVRALAREGWRVRAAVRRPDLAGHLQPMGAVGQIQPVQANLRYPDSVRRAVEGAEAVVNLVGILAKAGAADLRRRARGGRPRRRQGRPRGRRQDPGARLGDRRGQAGEIQLRAHQGGRRGGRAAGVSGRRHPAPVAGVRAGGRALQPLRRHGALLAVPAADRRRQDEVPAGLRRRRGRGDRRRLRRQGPSPGRSTSWAGPRSSPSASCSTRRQEWSGRKRRYLRIPFWAAKLGALLTLPLPNGLRPLTVDQIRMLQRDNVVSERGASGGAHAGRARHRAPAHHGGGRAGLPRALPTPRPVRALPGVTLKPVIAAEAQPPA